MKAGGSGAATRAAAMLAAAAANVIWGFGAMFSRIGLGIASPAVLMAWRFLTAFLALLFYGLVTKKDLRMRGKPLGWLLLMGVFEPALYFTLEQYGLLFSSASFTGIVLSLGPVACMGLGALFLRERVGVRQALFCLLSIAGVGLLSVNPESGRVATPLGALLLMGAVFSGAGYFTVNRGLSGRFTPFERTWSMAVLGVAFFWIWALLENRGSLSGVLAPLAQPAFTAAAVYLGLMSTAAAYLLISYAATHLSVARSTVFNSLYTIFSILTGVVFLHEPFLWALIPATVMILVGVWGVQRFSGAEADSARK